MFTLFLGSAFFGGGAYFAWQMLKALKKLGQGSQPEKSQTDDEKTQPADGGGDEDTAERHHERPIEAEDLLRRVVAAVKFTTTRRVVVDEVTSQVPTDIVTVRPMNSFAELSDMLPAAQAVDDDVFFGMAASHQIPVREFRDEVEIEEKKRNVLVVLQDCSGSMQHNGLGVTDPDAKRLRWSIRLDQRLATRAATEKAEMALICFNAVSREPIWARTPEECLELSRRMGSILFHDGGTDINGVLTSAMSLIQKEGFDEAHIVLVTDGTEGINEEFIKARLCELKIFLHTICIGKDHPQLQRVSQRYDLLPDACL